MSSPVLAVAFALVLPACATTPVVAGPPRPTGTGTCIPLFAASAFAVPDGWIVGREERGKWRLKMMEPGKSDVAALHVSVTRFDKCTPLGPGDRYYEIPLDPGFVEGYRPDRMEWSGSDGKSATSACVRGDKGALYVELYGYHPVFRPQLSALLTRIAEATDGMHACALPR